MLVGAAVCPHPPLVVPAVASGAADDSDSLRVACLAAVRRLTSLGVDTIVAVGQGAEPADWDGSAGGDLLAYGVDVSFGGERHVLPLSLTIAAYLVDDTGWSGPRRYVAVPSAAEAGEAATLGAALTDGPERVALLVMGDGSAKRAEASPGYFDPRAEPYDADVVAALTKPDPAALLALDAATADELWVAGRPAWQVLAGAAESAYAKGALISTVLRYDEAPYGVGYWVIDWVIDWLVDQPGSVTSSAAIR